MCISNELCTEIAVALLATSDKTDLELLQLKEIVIEVHAVLQQMEVEQSVGDRLRGGQNDEWG